MRQQAHMKVAGYLSRDPELRVTPSGDKVLGLSVPFTPRRRDKTTNEWVDAGPTLWTQASLWNQDAELFADKLAKGTFVLIEGEPTLRPWEKEGRSGVNLELKFARVAIVPTAPRPQAHGDPGFAPLEPQSDGWAVPGAFGDETPF